MDIDSPSAKALLAPADPDTLQPHAYYFALDFTGIGILDRIIHAIHIAGKAYHSTESWSDADEDNPSYVARIQAAIDEAAKAIRRATENRPASEPTLVENRLESGRSELPTSLHPKGDPTSDQTTIDLHSTTDATTWAAEFMRLFGDRKGDIDEGLMISWFANAIEIGRVAGAIRSPLDDASPVLVESLTKLGDEYGPLGVAIIAAHLTDPGALVRRLS